MFNLKRWAIEITILALIFAGVAYAANESYFPNGIKAGTMIIDSGSITDSSGAVSFGDGDITNVGDVALDSISSDAGTSINVNLGSDAGDDFTVDTSKLVVEGDTGYVGIGTPSPVADLNVHGAILLERDGGNQFGLKTSTQRWDFDITAPSNGLRIRNITSGTIPMTIRTDGNVGIGTTGPTERLHIVDSGADTGTINLGTGGNFYIKRDDAIFIDSAGAGTLRLHKDTVVLDDQPFIFGADEAFGMGYSNGNEYLQFITGGTLDTNIAMVINSSGNVGIGTTNPGNPLAVNRSADGVIVDFESADTVEGNVSISGNTTSYNAFVGSHYTQLKEGQNELPVGAVVISTGEIIPCSVSKQRFTKVSAAEATTIIQKAEAVETVDIEVEDKGNIISEITTYTYNPETDTEESITTHTYGTKMIQKKRLKDNVHFHEKTRKFYTINVGYVEKDEGFYREQTIEKLRPNKEYFTYIDTTATAADKRVYGVWLGKMSDNAKGMSFGNDSDPVYLVAQVGLFKIRVTDSNGDISNGDYLETSTRPMEAQKQTSGAKLNSTVAKALVDVDWSTVSTDVKLGYKWKLIPCTF